MKFIHLADLHIGKRINEYPLIEDQRYILMEILKIIDAEKPDGVFIAGDVYDKSQPSSEAVKLLDEFLSLLAERRLSVYVISGNHDCAERVAYGESVFEKQLIYLAPVFDGKISRIEKEDEYGRINVYLMPFLRPAHVKRAFPEAEIETYTDAVKCVIDSLNINRAERNIILAHQFITGAERCDSEDLSVGTLDDVDYRVFDDFDYAALGHIHKAQQAGRKEVRYAGTPLKYSASEAGHKKSVTVVELKEKGDVDIRQIPLIPMRDFKDITGRLDDVLKMGNERDYARITLTDEETVVDAYGKLKERFPYMTELIFERRERKYSESGKVSIEESKINQFAHFFEQQNGKRLTDEQRGFVQKLFEEIEEGGE